MATLSITIDTRRLLKDAFFMYNLVFIDCMKSQLSIGFCSYLKIECQYYHIVYLIINL